MSRYQDWIESEAERAAYEKWKKFHDEFMRQFEPPEETTSERFRRVHRHRALVNGIREMLQSRSIYGDVACDKLQTLMEIHDGLGKTS